MKKPVMLLHNKRRQWKSFGAPSNANTVSNCPHYKEMLNRMTIHGVMDFYQTDSVPWKILWLTILLIACGLATFEISRIVKNYLESPITSTYSIQPINNDHKFPILYLCPLNPFDKRKISNGHRYAAKLKQFFTLGAGMLEDTPFLSLMNKRFIEDNFDANFSQQIAQLPTRLTKMMSESSMETMDFIRECSFQHQSIDCGNITKKAFDAEHGQCYVVDVRRSQQTRGIGLNLVLDIRRDLYHKDLKPAFDGVLMSLIDFYSPSGVTSMVLLEPGAWTKVALYSRHYKLLNTRSSILHQSCNEEANWNYKYYNFNRYSKLACMLDYSQKLTMTNCGCILPADEYFLSIENIQRMCTIDQIQQCFFDELTKINTTSQIKELAEQTCLNPCEYWDYHKTISNLKFGTATIGKSDGCQTKIARFCPDDTIILDISYSDLIYTEIIQNPSMTIDTLISNIGGQVSLWMGVSVISVIQLSTLFVTFCLDKLESRRMIHSEIK